MGVTARGAWVPAKDTVRHEVPFMAAVKKGCKHRLMAAFQDLYRCQVFLWPKLVVSVGSSPISSVKWGALQLRRFCNTSHCPMQEFRHDVGNGNRGNGSHGSTSVSGRESLQRCAATDGVRGQAKLLHRRSPRLIKGVSRPRTILPPGFRCERTRQGQWLGGTSLR